MHIATSRIQRVAHRLCLLSLQRSTWLLCRHLLPQWAHQGFDYPRTCPGAQCPPCCRHSSARAALLVVSPEPSSAHLCTNTRPHRVVWRKKGLCVPRWKSQRDQCLRHMLSPTGTHHIQMQLTLTHSRPHTQLCIFTYSPVGHDITQIFQMRKWGQPRLEDTHSTRCVGQETQTPQHRPQCPTLRPAANITRRGRQLLSPAEYFLNDWGWPWPSVLKPDCSSSAPFLPEAHETVRSGAAWKFSDAAPRRRGEGLSERMKPWVGLGGGEGKTDAQSQDNGLRESRPGPKGVTDRHITVLKPWDLKQPQLSTPPQQA